MKIIRLSTYLDFGGLESRLANISHVQDNNEWIFVFMDRDGAAAEKIRANGKETINLNTKASIYSPKTFFDVLKIIKTIKPDVVHTSGAEANFHGIAAARMAGVKRVIAEEIGVPERSNLAKRMFSFIYKLADLVVGNSDAVIQYLHEDEGVPMNKLKTVANPVIFNTIEKSKTLFDGEKINLVTMSRLDPVKNLDAVLDVVKDLVEESLPIHYHMVGAGVSENDLKQKVEDLGIQDFVTMWGFQNNPAVFFDQADIYILNSFSEGFSNSLAEAMYYKAISITTDTGAAKEMITSGENGFIIAVDDRTALKETIKQIIGLSDQEKQIIGEKASKKIIDNYSLDSHMQMLKEIYR